MSRKKVGVLALQGDFEAHANALRRAGADVEEVRTGEELAACDALVIPGGESTTMLKLLGETGLTPALREFGAKKPIFGTCAGAILLACEVSRPAQESLGLMDIAVERNAYGRQLDSRIVRLAPDDPRVPDEFEAVFIRAPIIRRVGGGARVLARYGGDPVLVEQGRHLVATFHPELTNDASIHRLFLDKLEESR
jgi:pyridoxal 5'-phosphate synthase pdxT subunit